MGQNLKLDQEKLKILNRQNILNIIRNSKEISRGDLTEKTGLSPTTVSTITNELMENNMIAEICVGESSGGRKPIIFGLNKHAKYVITIRLTYRGAILDLVDMECNPIYRKEFKEYLDNEIKVRKMISTCLENIMSDFSENVERIVGIGISVPGVIDYKDNLVIYSSRLHLSNFDMGDAVRSVIDKKTYIFKDTDSMILGEYYFGEGREYKDLVYILVENGIGMSYVNSGKLFRLPRGGFELGHTTITSTGPKCQCGSVGCLGMLVSEMPALLRLNELIKEGMETSFSQASNLNYIDIIRASNNDDKASRQVIEEQAEKLGIGMANIVNLLNPELIIIGGPLIYSKWDLISCIKKSIKKHALEPYTDKLNIKFSKFGHESSPLGMANFILEDEVFIPINI
ncbi:ROK family transcriptional regulator [Clostridium lundense]|uniref:ROK family transcriptional regulator n=1 Tax=Clostridium lundense TaxID=319475 RepID=UPI00047F031C|nr:ROK family transcriptional regulator [Clostridium lundense]